jgi:hypothetical protein
MIAKGNLHSHGQKLATYLVTGKEDERAELVELKGFASSNIREAFIDVMIQAEATRCERPFFHAHVRLPEGEALTRDQWLYVADRIEQQLGFEGQGRAVSFHEQPNGDRHLHVAWSRIDLDQMRAIDPGLYKNQLKEVSRQLERELDLTRVRNERPEERKTLSAGRGEFEQARRLGTDLTDIRETIRACWERSDNGRSFEAALAEHGLVLARGDRRDFVVIDPAGGDHALGKRITGTTAAETRARLSDIDKQQLPSVDQAKAMQAERAQLAFPELRPTIARPDNERPAETFAAAARATAAPEPVQQPERSAAVREPEGGNSAPEPQPRAENMRDAGDVADRAGGLGVKALGKLFGIAASLFEGLFSSPPPPPTKEEVQRAERVDDERAEKNADREAAAKDAYFRQLLDQMSRDDADRRQREDGRERDDDDRAASGTDSDPRPRRNGAGEQETHHGKMALSASGSRPHGSRCTATESVPPRRRGGRRGNAMACGYARLARSLGSRRRRRAR